MSDLANAIPAYFNQLGPASHLKLLLSERAYQAVKGAR